MCDCCMSVLFSFFFFRQKTAYDVRISDWSSACALPISPPDPFSQSMVAIPMYLLFEIGLLAGRLVYKEEKSSDDADENSGTENKQRSEERRVGKERVSTCRCRWSRNHKKKKRIRVIHN